MAPNWIHHVSQRPKRTNSIALSPTLHAINRYDEDAIPSMLQSDAQCAITPCRRDRSVDRTEERDEQEKGEEDEDERGHSTLAVSSLSLPSGSSSSLRQRTTRTATARPPPPGYEAYSPAWGHSGFTNALAGHDVELRINGEAMVDDKEQYEKEDADSHSESPEPHRNGSVADTLYDSSRPISPMSSREHHDGAHTKKRRLKHIGSMIGFNDSNWSVTGKLPPGGKDAEIYNRRKVAQTVSFILGGWGTLIAACFGFKTLSIHYHLHAPDALAEYVNNAPTASTQWFTFSGVFLGEIALILWGHSIGYMAFRRLAYGKTRTELLTYAAWNEMSRAGYTLSRRRPLWPICTLLIFVANTFLPAGFSTLLMPKQMIIRTPYTGRELDALSNGFAHAVSFLPASTFPNPANLSCGSQFVSNFWTFASHPNTIFDPCPSLDDVQMLIMAGRAKLEASVNQTEPLFKLPGSLTYVGGTGGIASLGPLGILPWGSWKSAPEHSPTPQGYNYTYTLNQQGLSVDVKCWQPKTTHERSILTTHLTNVPHLLKATLKCGAGEDADVDVSYHYIGSSSIILKGCTSKNARGQDDPDSTVMYFKDAGAAVYGSQGSELGGDLLCELQPKWTRNYVEYSSVRGWIKVIEVPDGHNPPNRLTGYHGEHGPGKRPFSPTSEASKREFFAYYTRLLTVQNPLSAVGNAFAFTSSLSAIINATNSNVNVHLAAQPPAKEPAAISRTSLQSLDGNTSLPVLDKETFDAITVQDLRHTVLFGKDSAIQSLAAFNARVNAQKVKTWIQPSQVEIFIKGVFEYAATSQREWFQHYAVDGGGFYGAISVENGTVPVHGEWQQQTVGWGESTDNPTSFVYFSLIPMLCFALVSMGMIAWSHWFDAQREVPHAPDIDPTDWLDAVVASAQGGLHDAFPRDGLGTHRGRVVARKVRIRLGQIFEGKDTKPRLGFVCVD